MLKGNNLLTQNEFQTSFNSLKEAGYIFTPHDTFDQIKKKHRDIRVAIDIPENFPENGISFGPFPVPILYYENYKNLIEQNKAEATVLLAFKKIQYERTGNTSSEFKLQTNMELHESKDFSNVINLISNFELKKPHFSTNYVWYYPGDNIAKICKRKKSKFNYLCWDAFTNLNKEFNIIQSQKNTHIHIPNHYLDKWSNYLPGDTYEIIFELYNRPFKNGNHLSYQNEAECIKKINDGLKILENRSKNPDRELLIFELFSINQIKYPIQAEDYFHLFKKIGILEQKGSRIHLPKQFKEPSVFFKTIPADWKKKSDNISKTGSILFSYINPDELI